MSVKWLRTKGNLIVINKGRSFTLKHGTYAYKTASKFINSNNIGDLELYISSEKFIEKYTKGDFKMRDGTLTSDKYSDINEVLKKKVSEFAINSFPYSALKNFLKNIKKNPGKNSQSQLYDYLEHYNFPITEDGCFLAYKYVSESNGNLYDSHTGEYLNNPGCIVSMDRKKCCDDPNTACSTGLHVAAYDYATSAGSGQVIVVVKVNPKDVVSVPKDYQFQKIRCCRYEVLKKGTEQIDKSYYRSKLIVGSEKKYVSQEKMEINFDTDTAQEMVNKVLFQTGERITGDMKNRERVIAKASKILSKYGM